MSQKLPQPKGKQGSWLAVTNGVSYPCIWRSLISGKPMRYKDDNVPDSEKARSYVTDIMTKRKVILTKRKLSDDGSWRRNGYIALCSVDDVQFEKGVLTFRIVDRQDFR